MMYYISSFLHWTFSELIFVVLQAELQLQEGQADIAEGPRTTSSYLGTQVMVFTGQCQVGEV